MIPLSVRFAARELRAGVRGFRIFLACLALGVAAIAAANSTAEAFRQGLASQAREILGGDLAVSIRQRHFTAAERASFARLGPVSYAVASRAMAEAPSLATPSARAASPQPRASSTWSFAASRTPPGTSSSRSAVAHPASRAAALRPSIPRP